MLKLEDIKKDAQDAQIEGLMPNELVTVIGDTLNYLQTKSIGLLSNAEADRVIHEFRWRQHKF